MTILNLSETLREMLAKRQEICQLPAMFKNILPVLMWILLGCMTTLHAQNGAPADPTATKDPAVAKDAKQNNRFWQATVGGGEYMVALDRISAISRHKYVLDGALIVDEVTVDALGQALVRFYFITPISAAATGSAAGNAASRIVERGRAMVDHGAATAGTDIHNMVVKKFPETTHAREIEYRVLSEEELTGIYNSVHSAWETGHGRKFTSQ